MPPRCKGSDEHKTQNECAKAVKRMYGAKWLVFVMGLKETREVEKHNVTKKPLVERIYKRFCWLPKLDSNQRPCG